MAKKPLVEVDGDKEVIDALNRSEDVIKEETRRELMILGDYTIGRVRYYTEAAGAIDLGTLHDGIGYTSSTARYKTLTVKPNAKADKYAWFVEHGTKPHFPPISAIQGWADRHGIPAYLVARKIARDGTKPRYMWRDAFQDLNKYTEQRNMGKFSKRLVTELWK